MLYRDVIKINTKSGHYKNITDSVQKIISESGAKDGICNIFLKSTTSSIFVNEEDRMLLADIEKLMEKNAPQDKIYHHPSNAHSHLRSMLGGNTLSIPIADGKLFMGTWQSILFWEWDVDDREREIVVTING